jgi:uncharacterized repeat protein (TIGR01451 family)
MRTRAALFMLLLALVALTGLPAAAQFDPSFPENTDTPVDTIATYFGNLQVANGGVSLFDDANNPVKNGTINNTGNSQPLVINTCASGSLPTVRAAYVNWYSRWRGTGGPPTFDTQIDVAINGSLAQSFSASVGANTLFRARIGDDRYRVHGIVDVTTLLNTNLQNGINTVAVTNLDVPTPAADQNQHYGIGITAIYECPEFPYVKVSYKAGLDWFFTNSPDGGVMGDYSRIICETLPTGARNVAIDSIFGGQATPPGGTLRANDLFIFAGNGPPPTTLADPPQAYSDLITPSFELTRSELAWTSSAGQEWDVYNDSITLDADYDYVCIQAWSPNDFIPDQGVSGDLLSPVFTVEIPVVNLGDYVWIDEDQEGDQDAGEPPLPGATVELFSTTDNGATLVPAVEADGTTPVASQITDSNGNYRFFNLPPGDYVVRVTPPSNYLPTPVNEADPNTDDNTDSNIDTNRTPPSGSYESGVVTLEVGNEPADDGDGTDGNLTVDFGFYLPAEEPEYDLALRKTVESQSVTATPSGQTIEVTFSIEVFNQGDADASDIEVTDYILPSMFEAFDPALNPDGSTTGSATLPFTWSTAGGNAVATLSGTLPSGGSVRFPITLVVADGAGGRIDNFAEISRDDGDDIDSTPDGNNDEYDPNNPDTDRLTDDEISNFFNDEDDHDIAEIVVSTSTTYSIGNYVWSDDDNSGHVNGSETGIGGVLLELLDASGGVLETTTSDANGYYLFDDLATGDYRVRIAASNFTGVLDGYGPSTGALEESDPDSDGDQNDNGDNPSDPAATGITSGVFTLGDGEPTAETPTASGIDGNDGAGTPDINSNLTVDFGVVPSEIPIPGPSVSDPAIVKLVDPAFALPGEDVIWTVTISNPNSTALTGVQIEDVIPAELTILSATSSGGITSISGQTVTVSIPVLAPGASVQATIETRIRESIAPPYIIENVAVIQPPYTGSSSARVLSAQTLPETGEAPAWRMPLLVMVISALLLLVTVREIQKPD